ncbi:MAG: hypothetical protein PF489_12430 [Salinivirgaceae bacterium]|nr:hypothetical protein [Salinivirgaceae bacterium]
MKLFNLLLFFIILGFNGYSQFANWNNLELILDNGVVQRTISLPANNDNYLTTSYKPVIGTPQQVRDETKQRIEDLAPDGGFIFAPIHVIQNGVPPQNIMAWWETFQEFGNYE